MASSDGILESTVSTSHVESNGSQVQEREALIREQTMEASNHLCRVIEAILTLPHVTLSERLKIFDSI